jgi:hypothetical protein
MIYDSMLQQAVQGRTKERYDIIYSQCRKLQVEETKNTKNRDWRAFLPQSRERSATILTPHGAAMAGCFLASCDCEGLVVPSFSW